MQDYINVIIFLLPIICFKKNFKFNFSSIIKLPDFVYLKLVFISIYHFRLLDQFFIKMIFHFIINYYFKLQVPHFFFTIFTFLTEFNLFIIIIYYSYFNYFLLYFQN